MALAFRTAMDHRVEGTARFAGFRGDYFRTIESAAQLITVHGCLHTTYYSAVSFLFLQEGIKPIPEVRWIDTAYLKFCTVGFRIDMCIWVWFYFFFHSHADDFAPAAERNSVLQGLSHINPAF
ncbi:hypothetical protein EJB05_26283 [Eragrostis curvula]|uniref:Uncharacterized protein n=1 Tax=Eragrostis curvula TaxID=38414 RepID=A0A5J9UKV7_9POAL|nr:hypothetical protein EJB05_26283 [Eragrostis curvula]